MIGNEELTLVRTIEYIMLMKDQVLLRSIREKKDYEWLELEYKKIDDKIEDMVTFSLDTEEHKEK